VGQHPETTNSLGHNDLVGVVYQWTMRPEDKVKYDKAWRAYVASRGAAQAASTFDARGREIARIARVAYREGHVTLTDEAGLVVAVAVLLRS
jgi:hypothetical protein